MHAWSRGFRIHYLAEGSGEAVVLIPGLLQSAAHWADVGYLACFATAYRVIAVDMLGHGGSDRPHDPACYSEQGLAADIVAVLDAEGVEQAHLWGYAVGGRHAYAVAALFPDRVRSLAIGAYAAGLPTEDLAFLARVGGQPMVDALRGNDWSAFWRLMMLRDPATEALLQRANDPLAIAATIEGAVLSSWDVDLSRITAPTLLYVGSREPWVESVVADARAFGAAVAVVEGIDQLGTFRAIQSVAPVVHCHLESVTAGQAGST